ncbi:MAG TPA: amino acid adenylation domain-containing protein [Bryobacteraceae bacterium]|nr:amino acid adenylation domain-containing protein [Bryobacteraceae bacterium]
MLIHETVTRTAERRPNGVALVGSGETLTYEQLDGRGNSIGRLLKASGCKKGDRVGLLLPKSTRAIAAMLGSLKAGAMYVPMDLASPAARLRKIVDASDPAFILAARSAVPLLNALCASGTERRAIRVGWLDSSEPPDSSFEIAFRWADVMNSSTSEVACESRADDVAHLLFTSGSTGVPKGVAITHANVTHFLTWATSYFGTAETDRISCHPPLHFDLSTFDIYGTFLAGAELHLVPPEVSLLPHKVADFIRERNLTQWFSVPAVLKYMAQFDVVRHGDFPSLKRVLWCGEALPTPTLRHWMQRLDNVQFTNLYGPTETTIASSYYTVPFCPESDTADIPIGTACEGEELVVLDENLRPAPAGEIGELYIRGVGLSPGYWRDPEKTRSVFLTDDRGGRMYKTGDLARVDEDRLFYILGRADSQIKSRGYRIELGEIETAIHSLSTVRECAVVAIPTDGFEGNAICCAYVTPPGVDLSPLELRDRLTQLLPPYMLPSRWLAFGALPLNGNGKIDRGCLKEQFRSAAATA